MSASAGPGEDHTPGITCVECHRAAAPRERVSSAWNCSCHEGKMTSCASHRRQSCGARRVGNQGVPVDSAEDAMSHQDYGSDNTDNSGNTVYIV